MDRASLHWLRKELRKQVLIWEMHYERMLPTLEEGVPDFYPNCCFVTSMYEIRKDQLLVVQSLLKGEVDWAAFKRATRRKGWRW